MNYSHTDYIHLMFLQKNNRILIINYYATAIMSKMDIYYFFSFRQGQQFFPELMTCVDEFNVNYLISLQVQRSINFNKYFRKKKLHHIIPFSNHI